MTDTAAEPGTAIHTPQHPYEAFQAFRQAMEATNSAYRVTIRYFDRQAGQSITYEASLWAETEEAA